MATSAVNTTLTHNLVTRKTIKEVQQHSVTVQPILIQTHKLVLQLFQSKSRCTFNGAFLAVYLVLISLSQPSDREYRASPAWSESVLR